MTSRRRLRKQQARLAKEQRRSRKILNDAAEAELAAERRDSRDDAFYEVPWYRQPTVRGAIRVIRESRAGSRSADPGAGPAGPQSQPPRWPRGGQ